MKKLIIGILAATALTACGSTSGIKTAQAVDGKMTEEGAMLDFSAYNAVYVKDFTDGTKKQNLPEFAGRNFADRIAAAVSGTGVFEVVTRDAMEAASKKTIEIGGQIERYKEGSSAMRMIVGFGAGSSYFDANVEMKDKDTAEVLGVVEVDKNSNPLGGTIAMTQTVDNFMSGAAEKIAKELKTAKMGPELEEKDDK